VGSDRPCSRRRPDGRGAGGAGPADRRALSCLPGRVIPPLLQGTIGRWIRAWRAGGLGALRPSPRAGTGVVRAHPELFAEASALRLELPGRAAAQIASILYHRHGVRVSGRTVRAQPRRAGLHREALATEPTAFGRYEAGAPNDRWITDVRVCPWVRFPKRDGSARARLFLIVDDHSRLLADGRFFAHENARAGQELLCRAITRRPVPAARR
jgi:putative transposase